MGNGYGHGPEPGHRHVYRNTIDFKVWIYIMKVNENFHSKWRH